MAGAKLTVDEACAYLRVSRSSFYTHVRPYVPAIAVGKRIVFDAADLEAFAERQKALNAPAPAAPPMPVAIAPGRRKWKVGPSGEFVWFEPKTK